MTSAQDNTSPAADHRRRRVFGFLLLDQYPLLPVSGMIDILRDADYVTSRSNFNWFTISAEGAEVAAMNHLRVRTEYTIDNAPPCDVIVVCAGLGGHLIDDDRVFRWLRKQYASKVVIGSIATGTWVLAKAGLLHDHRCTLHWEDIPAFEETYPRIDVARSLYVRDGQIFTCTGGTAAIDLFLQFVTESLGAEVSSNVARQILHQSVRVGSDMLPIKGSPYLNIPNRILHDATELMHDHLENLISIATIAQTVGVSQKHLERLFRNFFQTTPQLHYRAIRLDHARALVRLTKFDIWQIAIIAGFSSAQYFSRCYRRRFSVTPTEERKMLVQYAIPGTGDARG